MSRACCRKLSHSYGLEMEVARKLCEAGFKSPGRIRRAKNKDLRDATLTQREVTALRKAMGA